VRVRLLLAPIAVALVFASAAHAALAPCPGQRGVECATVTVPLDRSGAVPGTIDLFVQRYPAASGRSRGTLVMLAGGPGEAATTFAAEWRRNLAGFLRDHDLVVFDQRGTGRSAPLVCAGLERGDDFSTAVPACAQQLGAASALYTSLDSAEDLDAVRAALGLEKIDLYGV